MFIQIFAGSPTAFGQVGSHFTEILYTTEAITANRVEEWNSFHGSSVGYRVEVTFSLQDQLKSLMGLHFRSLQIAVRRIPARDSLLPLWKALAKKGAELVVMDAPLLSSSSIDVLNEISFEKIIFMKQYFPASNEGRFLEKLKSKWVVTFFAGKLPTHPEMPLFDSFQKSADLVFVAHHAPWYTHMDVLNFLGFSPRIRIVDVVPSGASVDYIKNIKNLRSLTLESDYAVSKKTWHSFGNLDIFWSVKDWIPPLSTLKAFQESANESSGERKLTLHYDWNLTKGERKRLMELSIPVTWVHKPI